MGRGGSKKSIPTKIQPWKKNPPITSREFEPNFRNFNSNRMFLFFTVKDVTKTDMRGNWIIGSFLLIDLTNHSSYPPPPLLPPNGVYFFHGCNLWSPTYLPRSTFICIFSLCKKIDHFFVFLQLFDHLCSKNKA